MENLDLATIIPAVAALVAGVIIGRLTSGQRAAVALWAPLVRVVARKLAAMNPERDPWDVAAEAVEAVCRELGIPEEPGMGEAAAASAELEARTVDATKGGPD